MIALSQSSSKFCYTFVPTFSEELFECPVKELEDFVGKCEVIFEELKFAKRYFECEKVMHVLKNDDLAIEMWITLWCMTFPYHEIYEHDYRLNQLLETLHRYKIRDESKLSELYTNTMQTCHTFGSARLATVLFASLKSAGARSSFPVLSVYLAAVASGQSAQPLRCVFKPFAEEVKDCSLDYSVYFSSCQQSFSQRTFLTPEIEYVVSEEVKLGFGLDDCSQCNTSANLSSVVQKNLPVLCEKCKAELSPRLKVRVGRPITLLKDKPSFWQHDFSILTPKELTQSLCALAESKQRLRVLNVDLLRNREELFWNVVWHCQVHELPYDLFLPYKRIGKESVVWKKQERKEMGVKFETALENAWADQFKHIRIMALCNDKVSQT